MRTTDRDTAKDDATAKAASKATCADGAEVAGPPLRGWARIAATIRTIIGAPDYASYVAHVRAHHPEREPMSEREFVAERLKARYEQPGSRCC